MSAATANGLDAGFEGESYAFDLSFGQQGLWLEAQASGPGAHYNMPVALRLRGQGFSVAWLQAAFNALVARHEALRTVFGVADGVPRQIVREKLNLAIRVTDLEALAPADRPERLAAVLRAEAAAPFDLGSGPLLRVALVRLDAHEHVLQLTTHHIVSDQWSLGVLVHELLAFYTEQAGGAPAQLPALPIQYADYAVWQREREEAGHLQRQLDYWKRQLDAAPPLLELPCDRPRPARQTYRGASHAFTLPPQMLARLKELASAHGATLFMVVQAAFALLLHRYGNQDDICVGTPVAGRQRVELEGLIGLFVNTVVLRTRFGAPLTFEQLLLQARQTALEAYANQDVPFDRLVEALNPRRSLSHAPLFQVMFVLQNAPRHKVALPGLEFEHVHSRAPAAKYDLVCELAEGDQGLHGILDYSTDLFDAASIARLAGHYQALLVAACEQPGASIEDLLLRVFRLQQPPLGAPDAAAATESLVDRFREQAQNHADKSAVVGEHAALSYRELDALSARVAAAVRERCGDANTAVGLLFGPGAAMVAGIFGALKAGKAYVPLDPRYPQDRLRFFLADSGAVALVTDAANLELARRLADGAVPVLDIDDLGAASAPESPVAIDGDALAYILYTSGSTGRPKGVAQSHRNALHFAHTYAASLRIGAEDRVALLASYSFDAAVMDIFGALLHGAALFPMDARSAAPQAIAARIAQQRITVYHSTPTLLRHLYGAPGAPAPEPAHARFAVLGGEPVAGDDVALFNSVFPSSCVLVNGYGPTESTLATQNLIAHGAAAPGTTVATGTPVDGVRIALGHADSEPQAFQVGEIIIKSRYVALGYWRQPELTAQAFGMDARQQRFFRTGDIGRWGADGSLTVLGRRDDQVKIRGFRVELGEIESALAEVPGVAGKAVALREDQAGGKALVAYLVPRAGAEGAIDIDGARAALARKLPEYMVPAQFVVLPELPLTPSGKVDRRALPAPDDTARGGADHAAPATDAEKALAAIWAQVLKVERIGVDDDFFELGGHSLAATRVMHLAAGAFRKELSLRALLEYPRLGALARYLDEPLDEDDPFALPDPFGPDAPLQAIAVVDRAGAQAASYAQQRLWFLDRYEAGGAQYNLAQALRLVGPGVSVQLLQQVLLQLVQRHETLRTVFAPDADGQPCQVILQGQLPEVGYEDLSGLPPEQAQVRAQELARQAAQAPFDLARGPLLRVKLLKLAAQEHLLVLTLHHIVSDGWSMGVLVGEVAQLYEAQLNGTPARLAPLPVQYADYAAWQRERLQGERLQRLQQYWQQQLEGAPALLELPTDRPRPALQGHSGSSCSFELPGELAQQLHKLAQANGATLFMVLQAAFALLLHRYSGQHDICVGTPVAGRERAELEGLIGFFVNTLVLRTRIEPQASFEQLIAQAKEAALGAYAHQELPFEQLVEHLRPQRSLSYAPLFQVMFVLQNAPHQKLELPGLSLQTVGMPATTAKFDLLCSLTEQQDGVAGTIEYNTDLFDRATVQRFAEHYEVLLRGICEQPALPVKELAVLSGREQRRILLEWNDTAAPYPREQPLHRLFEQQARRTPEAVALVFEDTQLTYAELNARANRLAHHLRDLGVGPDVLVAVCAERSVEMVVALLATLKAGGAYVPLDPGYPGERLGFMLADAQPRVLLTQQALLASLPVHEVLTFCLDSQWSELPARDTNPPCTTLSAHLAYVIYTSGSTGRPKGAGNTHEAIGNRLHWMQALYPLDGSDRVVQKTPFGFDVSVWEFFWPLLSGARLVMARPEGHKDPQYLLELIAQARITVAHFVPSMLEAFLAAVQDTGALASLRRVACSGEALPLALQHRFFEVTGGAIALHNLYGPTEAAVEVTHWQCRPDGPPCVPIGRPITNLRMHVLDAQRMPVPVGVAGELHIAGMGLARGYLNRPDLTADKFVPDPYGPPGSRMYKTGDLARYLADGNIEYLGRLDNQVKLRGFRIELGEIENALQQQPGVAQAVVALREDEAGRRLVAYVVPAVAGGPPQPEPLTRALRQTLPDYMVPGTFVVLEQLPLLSNGKVDRRTLPAPGPRQHAGSEYVAPRSDTEKAMALMWAELLAVDRVGLHDNFFALGGHSLQGLRLIERIRQVHQVAVPIKALFSAPTLAEFATVVDERRLVRGLADAEADAGQESVVF
ncbi:MAG: amino acid adenylation domain-containing protein [Pseudomonadota bacterium]